ncbi:MAG: hypothetical protein JKY37_32895 [Nannocystaceae bacterium]|nr:hypothetical protein [Nannocystaceae bacterium]
MGRSLFARLFRRYHSVTTLSALLDMAGDRVEIEGFADPVARLEDPLSGERCVAIEYRAWPPSTTLGIDGGSGHNGRAYQLAAQQAVDFTLTDGPISVLVRVDAGKSVDALHTRLLEQFGVGLRAETDTVATGAKIRVAGRVDRVPHGGSPHRTAPQTISLVADRFWVVEA